MLWPLEGILQFFMAAVLDGLVEMLVGFLVRSWPPGDG
jgi:hypothetical protein